VPAIPCFAGTGQGIGNTTSHAARKCIVLPIHRKADYGGLRRDEGEFGFGIKTSSISPYGVFVSPTKNYSRGWKVRSWSR